MGKTEQENLDKWLYFHSKYGAGSEYYWIVLLLKKQVEKQDEIISLLKDLKAITLCTKREVLDLINEIGDEFNEYVHVGDIDNEKYNIIKTKIEQLAKMVGENHPECTRYYTLLDFLAGKD